MLNRNLQNVVCHSDQLPTLRSLWACDQVESIVNTWKLSNVLLAKSSVYTNDIKNEHETGNCLSCLACLFLVEKHELTMSSLEKVKLYHFE